MQTRLICRSDRETEPCREKMTKFRPISGRLKSEAISISGFNRLLGEKGVLTKQGVGMVGKDRGRGEPGGPGHAHSSNNGAVWECTLVPRQAPSGALKAQAWPAYPARGQPGRARHCSLLIRQRPPPLPDLFRELPVSWNQTCLEFQRGSLAFSILAWLFTIH